ncbi:MAG: hypothetical protein SGILL_010355, partial [Bacillariaceae sp.]
LLLSYLLTLTIRETIGWRPSLPWRKSHVRRSASKGNEKDPSTSSTPSLHYDMIIVGAGASGMFAAGASTMLGSKTLLLDVGSDNNTASSSNNIGGDCTNLACVPSKALRSVSKMASMATAIASVTTTSINDTWMPMARDHMTTTVNKVRARESPLAMVERNPNLDIALLSTGHFVGPKEMELDVTQFYSNNVTNNFSNQITRVTGKKFLIATGASPIVPEKLEQQATAAKLPLWTYRTLLRQDDQHSNSFWELTQNHSSSKTMKIVIAGGGATAMELCQSLARLGGPSSASSSSIEIHLVAPELLPGEDVALQNAALQLLLVEKRIIKFHLGQRVESVTPTKNVTLSDGSSIAGVHGMILCLGRRPALEALCLNVAEVDWDHRNGILVNPSSLQSISAPHVFACGDCSSAINQYPTTRTATHAAWTGYHAASNAILPRFLTYGSKSVHSTVPRVVYTDPELASVGMSLSECVLRYGVDGFARIMAGEEGTDRADMESLERHTSGIGFVEIRATKVDGKVLGMTACGPVASELANEVSVVIENGLTVRDIARSLHSYPSHGYLLHRVALSLTLGNIWGSLEACSP